MSASTTTSASGVSDLPQGINSQLAFANVPGSLAGSAAAKPTVPPGNVAQADAASEPSLAMADVRPVTAPATMTGANTVQATENERRQLLGLDASEHAKVSGIYAHVKDTHLASGLEPFCFVVSIPPLPTQVTALSLLH